jgi:hypothetical protein
MRSRAVALVCGVMLLALGVGAASADTMHPTLGARLSGMGEHGIVNLTLKSAKHELCWTFDIPTKGVTAASVRDAHGMIVAKLGSTYAKKGCAMAAKIAITRIETSPTKYRVWVDTKGHPGDLRGALFVGMAHM